MPTVTRPKGLSKTVKAQTAKAKSTKHGKLVAPELNSHSASDSIDEFKSVGAVSADNLCDGISVRFDLATLNKIRILAKTKGLGTTSLIRMWVMERLQKENDPNY